MLSMDKLRGPFRLRRPDSRRNGLILNSQLSWFSYFFHFIWKNYLTFIGILMIINSSHTKWCNLQTSCIRWGEIYTLTSSPSLISVIVPMQLPIKDTEPTSPLVTVNNVTGTHANLDKEPRKTVYFRNYLCHERTIMSLIYVVQFLLF